MTNFKSIFDAELVLRASEAVTATSNGVAKAHPLTPTHYLNDAHHETIAVVVRVTAIVGAPTLDYQLQVDTASGFPSAVTVASLPITAVGEYVIPLDLVTVENMEPGATHIRDRMVVTGGTTPSVTFSSRITRANIAS